MGASSEKSSSDNTSSSPEDKSINEANLDPVIESEQEKGDVIWRLDLEV